MDEVDAGRGMNVLVEIFLYRYTWMQIVSLFVPTVSFPLCTRREDMSGRRALRKLDRSKEKKVGSV
jgi:hypothetical protein